MKGRIGEIAKEMWVYLRFLNTFLIILLLGSLSWAQNVIFPGIYGEALLDSLVNDYKPNTVLSYAGARDFMFGTLDNENDSVTCVYTGFMVYIDPNSSDPPRTVAFNAGLNTEHTWPQSLGSSGDARANLHHLFPTRIDVNNARANYPFDDIPDALTDRWFRLAHQQSSIPSQHIDEYSEVEFQLRFEPREDHKGNIARAMFYFYTMYRDQSDTTFFPPQKNILRSWNSQDPVDAEEMHRTTRIATQQDGKPNPFVLDTSLIGRAYFGVVNDLADNSIPEMPSGFALHQNYPNPFNPVTTIPYQLPIAGNVELDIYNLPGQKVRTLVRQEQSAGNYQIRWGGRNDAGQKVSSGIYIYRLKTGEFLQSRKMILIR